MLSCGSSGLSLRLVLLATITGCSASDPTRVIERAEGMVLFEGLPAAEGHEGKEFAEEVDKETNFRWSHDYFYNTSLELKPGDSERLKRSLIEAFTSIRKGPPHKCGFHADFMIQFSYREETWTLLLCFGCNDAILFRAEDRTNGITFSKEIANELLDILEPYRTNRPSTKFWPKPRSSK
jgi:hypothetical protein